MNINEDISNVATDLLPSNSIPHEKYGMKIFNFNSKNILQFTDSEIYLKSPIFILVYKGNSVFDLNFTEYRISTQSIMILSVGHILKLKKVSDDFLCSVLYVDEKYINEMYSSDMIYRRAKYQVRLFKKPFLNLDLENFSLLNKRLSFIQEALNDIKHLYQDKLILLSLQVFFLDISSLVERMINNEIEKTLSRDEVYFHIFLELLAQNYEKEHEVHFYAKKINISTHYLTSIVKRLTGQTVSEFLYQLLFGDAKLLLQNPDLSIKKISDKLNFSDQSAFGKFFKRRSGVSPLQFRRISLK